jgi:hypothetical protein
MRVLVPGAADTKDRYREEPAKLVAPALPYARPGEVGLSSEKPDRLGDDIVSWIANGELLNHNKQI